MGVRTGLAAVVAVGIAVFVPLSASADPEVAAVTRAYVSGGHATFESHGEHLYACDDSPDNRTIKAEAMWDHTIRAEARDLNGFGGGCGETNSTIPEGKDVNIRACVSSSSGWLCGDWVDSEA